MAGARYFFVKDDIMGDKECAGVVMKETITFSTLRIADEDHIA